MKKYIVILVTLTLALSAVAQQSDKDYRKSYREGELKFIQQTAILTDAEFAEFTTIYNAYRDARRKVRQETKQIKAEEGLELTDEQAAYNVQAKVTRTVRFAELYKDYIARLQAKFSNKQILSIEQAQAKYKKVKFRELRDDSVKAAGAFQSGK